MSKASYESPRVSLDEYFAFEEKSSIKHEYLGGEVYAMSGTTIRHGRIAFNIARHLHSAARSHGCAIVLSDVKVRAASDRYEDVTLPPLTVKEDEAWYATEWADYAVEDA